MPMRWCCLQHVPFEGPSYLAVWCHERGFPLSSVELWKDHALPGPDEFEGLFVLGGPMNVYEEAKYPWLSAEKEFIAQAISDHKPILGVCLGAQLLSVVLGGTVSKMVNKEIGWFPVDLTPAGRESAVFQGLPQSFVAFHWHGDFISIPPHATQLARSTGCELQAFDYNNHVVGLQFHLEASEPAIASLIKHCAEDICRGQFIQDSAVIASNSHYIAVAQAHLTQLLDNLVCTSKLEERRPQ